MRSFRISPIQLLFTLKIVLAFQIGPSISFSARPSCYTLRSSAIREAKIDVHNDVVVPSIDILSDPYREFSFHAAKSFQAREFRPATPLLSNKHVQTISGALLRDNDSCRYVTNPSKKFNRFGDNLQILASAIAKAPGGRNQDQDFWDQRERIETPDGDFFHVDSKFVGGNEHSPSTKGIVLIVHGLQSNSNGTLVIDMGKAFIKQGLDVACINFRGCSGEPNLGLKAYHLGFTDDLKYYLSLLKKRMDTPKPASIYIVGKSLGANVVLNTLGELGESARTEFNVRGAAVNCVPFDNGRNKQFLSQGFSKIVYSANLLKSLKATAYGQLERFASTEEAQLVDLEMLSKATTITEFDEAYIAPIFGFQNHVDYYNKTSCLNFLDRIRIPTLILSSADDPFMDPDFFPWEYGCESDLGQKNQSPIRMVRSEHGGHLGYMFHAQKDEEIEDEDDNDDEPSSFMPTELARFISHVRELETTNDL